MAYTELQVTTNFSFLRGASHPDELVDQAALYGYKKIAITDRNTLAGVVRAHVAAKSKGIQMIPAVRLDLEDGPSLLAYPTDKAAYGRLSALLTLGNLRAPKGKCQLFKADVYQHAVGMKFIAVPPPTLDAAFEFTPAFKISMQEYREAFGKALYLGAQCAYDGDEAKKLFRLSQLEIPMVATNDVHYHIPERRQLQDIITCVREKCTIHEAGFKLHAHAERFLKPQAEIERLFRHYPDAVTRTEEIAESCNFSLDSLTYVYPEEITREGRTPQEEITHLAWQGAHQHYGAILPQKIIQSIHHELKFIEEMDYACYFLTVYDIVREARQRGILCQGRGSAANSTVCFCLGITSVDPTKFDLLFERFISSARAEPPDIDVDFEHERREEMIQYVYGKYGRDRAAIVATVIQMHHKGAVRDVGKAMGLSKDVIDRLSVSMWEFTDEWLEGKKLQELGLNPEDRQLKKVLVLTKQYMGFPRQLGQHTGGFVITNGKLSDLCPVMNATMTDRTQIELNKDDVDALGFLKIDVLALGMLTMIRKAFDLIKEHYKVDFSLATVPQDDPKVYEMISLADTLGVFQIESRAQMSMLPRLQPKCFYDLVIEVAIVRPGPILGDMVHPYLRRRNGEEPVEYPSKELEEILKRTLGVPLFQEQAMKIAIVAAGFTPTEADQLRRAMATFKLKGQVSQFQKKLIEGMRANGYTQEYSERVFKQLEGFGSYGFPESHAASFALLVYVSCYIKCYYPDVFATALLNSQPMGFYQPAQIVADARKHGVEIRPVDVNASAWDHLLEEKSGEYFAIRLGFRQVKSLRQAEMQQLIVARIQPFDRVEQLAEIGVPQSAIETLNHADAFRSLGLERRKGLWAVTALKDRPIGLFNGQPSESSLEPPIALPIMGPGEHVVHDYATTALSLKGHPVRFVRSKLTQRNVLSTKEIGVAKHDRWVKVAGIVTVRQRPGTAGGVCFITIEDESGFSNLIVWPAIFDKYRKEILRSKLLMVEGKLQRQGNVVHVIVHHCFDYSDFFRALNDAPQGQQLEITFSRADEKTAPYTPQSKRRPNNASDNGNVIPKGRNFK